MKPSPVPDASSMWKISSNLQMTPNQGKGGKGGRAAVDMFKSRAVFQKDPDRKPMKSSKVKCQFLSLGRRNCWDTYRLGPDGFGSIMLKRT